MIFAFVLILVLCSAFSFPQYNHFSDISDIKFISKKNDKLSSQDNDSDLVEQQDVYDEAQGQIAEVDAKKKRKFENSTLGNGFGSWSLYCKKYCSPENLPGTIRTDGNSARQNDDDILLHLSGDKDLYKFLEWTMEQLGSVNSYNASGSYYTGLNISKKGLGDVPLYVEEPKYIVLRREPDYLEQKLNVDEFDVDFPFKYFPNLESLFAHQDTFIPHRGRKDKLKDIFKYDEIFFAQRGKKSTSSEVFEGVAGAGAGAGTDGGILQGKNKMRTTGSGYYNYRSSSADTAPSEKNDCRAFGDWLTSRCDDITVAEAEAAVAPSPHQQQVVTNQAENINTLVSAASHLPQPCQAIFANANDNDAIAADGHQDARALAAAAAAACQKKNDVKINGFDQSVRAQQIRQRQHSEGGALKNQQRNRQRLQRQRQRRRLLSSLSSESETFLPLSQSDQLNRLQQYPIRNKQWNDYYTRQMAALARQFPPY